MPLIAVLMKEGVVVSYGDAEIVIVYCVPPKMTLLWLAITSTYINRF